MKLLRYIILCLAVLLTCVSVDGRRYYSRSKARSYSRGYNRNSARSSRYSSQRSYRSSRAVHSDPLPEPFMLSEKEYEEMLVLCDPDGLNDPEAQFMLGNYFYQQMIPNMTVDSAYMHAAYYWGLARENKHPKSTGNLAYCYRNGLGVEPDTLLARSLYIESLSLGNESLLDMLMRSADNGEAFDAWILYYCAHNGQGGVDQDDELANNYLEMLSEYGDDHATRLLGDYYFKAGQLDSALYYYDLISDPSARSAYINNELKLGSKPKIMEQIRRLAKDGYKPAIEIMDEIIASDTQKNSSTPSSAHKESAQWKRTAAANGSHEEGMALADMLVMGNGVERDFDQAIYFLENSLPGGHSREYLNALFTKWYPTSFKEYMTGVSLVYDGQYDLARDYYERIRHLKGEKAAPQVEARIAELDLLTGVDPAEVFRNLAKDTWSNPTNKDKRKARKNVSPASVALLAHMLYNGQGIDRDEAEAEKWAAEAAAQGNARAHSLLGDIAFDRRDYAEAVKRYAKALEATGVLYPASRKNYIECLEKGLGIEPNPKLAEVLTRAVPANLTNNVYLVTINAVNPHGEAEARGKK